MIIASIDIGSNTVLLLIAEVNEIDYTIKPLLNEYRMPRLSKGLSPGDNISNEKTELLLEILSEYKKIIDSHKAEKVILTATNAFRIAANAKEIVELVKLKFGYGIEVIPGSQEAEYAFLGALSAFENSVDKNLVIDIGGGSTELILGDENNIEFRKSFQTGSVSATEKFIKHYPVLTDEITKLSRFLDSLFEEIKGNLFPQRSIAIAGTPTTISCMIQNLPQYNETLVEGSIIHKTRLIALIDKLKTLTPSEVKINFGEVMRGREDIILAGAVILLKIMELLNLSEVLVSSRGIRYGAIVHYLRNRH